MVRNVTRAIGAVDIGGTKIAAGCVDGEGRLLARRVDATEPARGWECAVDRIAAMLGDACRECGAALDGIGIGCTGMVDPAAGTVVKPDLLPGWHGAPVRSEE